MIIEYPDGGKARVSTKRDYYPDGREFIGIGVLPDILVSRSVKDIRENNDVVLNKAIDLLNSNLSQNN